MGLGYPRPRRTLPLPARVTCSSASILSFGRQSPLAAGVCISYEASFYLCFGAPCSIPRDRGTATHTPLSAGRERASFRTTGHPAIGPRARTLRDVDGQMMYHCRPPKCRDCEASLNDCRRPSNTSSIVPPCSSRESLGCESTSPFEKLCIRHVCGLPRVQTRAG